MYVYINGQFIEQENAKISAFDHGFMYGLGLFETFRVYKGHPFLLDDHFQRLNDGLIELNIDWEIDRDRILTILSELLAKNNLTDKDAYIRWNVSAGVGSLGLQVDAYTEPTTIVYMKSVPEQQRLAKKRGVILETKRNNPEGNVRMKSHHFLNNVLGKREVGKTNDCEGIFLNGYGHVAEGVVSNIFWVKDGIVYTPAVETGILDGITRRFILTLLEQENIPYEVGYYAKEELLAAKEAFVTNSIQEIVALTHVDDKALLGLQGDVTQRLHFCYQQYKNKLWSRLELEGKDH